MWYKILKKEKRRCGKTNRTYCFVECQLCHSTKWIREDSLKNKKVVSCGCYNKAHNYLKELKEGAVNKYGVKLMKKIRKDEDEKGYIWLAECNCGNLFEVSTNRFHERKSCGCLASENGKTNIGKVQEEYYKDNTSILQVAKEGTMSTNTSGKTGVTYDKARSKWMATIEFKKKRYYLGRYAEKKDAIFAREEAERYLFGEFIEWYSENYPEQWERINKGKAEKSEKVKIMMKFELKECTREIKYKERFEIAAGCTANQDDCESKLIKSFDSKEDALEELKNYKTEINSFSSNTGTCYNVTEYFVEEAEYDEDGDWIAGGDIWGFSKMEIEIVEKPSYDTVGAFDNLEDAEKAMDELIAANSEDEYKEYYLSF